MADDVTVAPADARSPIVIGMDIGSSSVRAIAFDARGRSLDGREARREHEFHATADGGVTADPGSLAALVYDCLDELTACLDVKPAAVGVDTFWHSVLGIDENGTALTPVLTWADTRSREDAEMLKRVLDPKAVHDRTGAVLSASYVPAKIHWLRRTQPEVADRVRHWVTFGEYLYLQLFGDLRVSISAASGSGMFDQSRCIWDSAVLGAIQVSEDQLAPLGDFDDARCGLRNPFAERWPSLAKIPWCLPVGDGACNNLGSGGCTPESPVLMVGTSGALRVVRASDKTAPPPGLWTYRVDRRRLVQGGALSNGGNVYAWLTETLQLPGAGDVEEAIARMAPDCHGLTVLPFLAGERSPDWNASARAVIAGMGLDTNALEIVRASLEAIAYRFRVILDALRSVIPEPAGIIGSGAGLLHSPAWMQIISDVLEVPVTASAVPEATSRGAALLALEAIGAIDDLSRIRVPLGQTYPSQPATARTYRAAFHRQQALYDLVFAPDSPMRRVSEKNI